MKQRKRQIQRAQSAWRQIDKETRASGFLPVLWFKRRNPRNRPFKRDELGMIGRIENFRVVYGAVA
ncbi:MAG: hypothetical protein RL227_1403 [Pseudomonadota bacterium]|jgi:hypothetical protein